MLYRLVYTSHATGQPCLQDILAASIKWNESHDITGGLVCVGGTYLQYLEGEEFFIDQVFAMISRDRRHHDLKLLERREVSRRMFTDWSMAVLKWNDETKAIFHSFSPGHKVDLYTTDPSTAAPMFRAWVATKHWDAGAITPTTRYCAQEDSN
ncbi:MAG: BLUF domain-containing protein [Janthinobacterium lividum]